MYDYQIKMKINIYNYRNNSSEPIFQLDHEIDAHE